MEPGRKRRGRGKRQRTQFIDAAMDGYIRDQALEKWRMVEDAMAINGLALEQALQENRLFPEKGAYGALWSRCWDELVPEAAPADGEHPIARIEAAVRAALEEEREARKAAGEPDIEDTLHYKAFVDRALEHLLEEASGEIEELD